MAMNITELHAENFEQEVVNADRAGVHRLLGAVVRSLPDAFAGHRGAGGGGTGHQVLQGECGGRAGLAAQFGVSSIPTLIFSKNGALTGRTVGFRPKAELLELIDGIKD